MTVKEAIKILGLPAYGHATTFDTKFYDALKLGIEALKFRQRLQKAAIILPYKPLPGETDNETT